MTAIATSDAWSAQEDHAREMRQVPMRDLAVVADLEGWRDRMFPER